MSPQAPSAAGEPRPAARHERWAFLAIPAVAIACYANSLSGEFVFDDLPNVVHNVEIRDPARIARIVSSGFLAPDGAPTNYYRPVPSIYWMGILAAFGLTPAAFHAASVLLHAVTAGLVFHLARLLTPARTILPAAAGAVVFALHPVNTENVAWISGAVDVCATFFTVLALYAYVRAGSGRRSWAWQGGSAAALLLALLSKESAAAAVPAMMAWDLAFRRDRLRSAGAALRAWAPLLAVTAVYVALRVSALGGVAPVAALARNGPLAAPVLLGRYLELLAFPARLSVLHDVPVDVPLASVEVLRGVVAIVALTLLAALVAKGPRRHLVWFVMLVVPLLPALYAQAASRPIGVSNRLAERHLYLTTVGLALAFAAAGAWVETRGRRVQRVALAVAIALGATFASLTVARNRVWRDGVSLWSDAVAKYPGLAEARLNLGLALRERGDADRGAAELREAVALDRMVVVPHFAMGTRALERGEYHRAVSLLSVVALAAPETAQAHFYLGLALERAGDAEGAAAELQRTIQLSPGHGGAAAALRRLPRAEPLTR